VLEYWFFRLHCPVCLWPKRDKVPRINAGRVLAFVMDMEIGRNIANP